MTAGEAFGLRVAAVRKQRGWSRADLSQRLTEIGRPTDRAVIARIESRGTRARNASLEEVLAFAAALGVAPLSLVVPRVPDILRSDAEIDVAETLSIAGEIELPRVLALAWIKGRASLNSEDRPFYEDARNEAAGDDSWPERIFERLADPQARDLAAELLLATKAARSLVRAGLEDQRKVLDRSLESIPTWVSDAEGRERLLAANRSRREALDGIAGLLDELDEKEKR